MSAARAFTWKLQDRRTGRVVGQGGEPSAQKAQVALRTAMRRAGGWRTGFAAGITRLSGGGWLTRWASGAFNPTWEEWEPEVL